jgi:hypothetical protein
VVFVVLQFFFFIEMVDVKEQYVCIKFCLKPAKRTAETHKMLKQASGDDALGQTQTYFEQLALVVK